MSLQYRAIGWNRQKKIYDRTVLGLVGGYLALFVGVGAWVHPYATIETLLIRGLGTAAFLLLHVILSIGPLCRIDRRFLPLLYNRRHLGVTLFWLAAAHGLFALVQFHAAGDLNPLVSLLAGNTRYDSLAQFPFQQLGLLALLILFLMAATSHDFWLHNLSPRIWKGLHMSVYLAYGLLMGHVTLGVLQSETSPLLAAAVALGLAVVLALHCAAAWREHRLDRARHAAGEQGFVEAFEVDSIPNNRARVLSLGGERIAVFRYEGCVSALSNVCAHQNGPLGEGKVIDGCVTCPWHGYQYLPGSGASPPPFHEKVATFRVRVMEGQVFVHPMPLPPGTPVEPARVPERAAAEKDEFYIGYEPQAPVALGRRIRGTVMGLAAIAAAYALVWVVGQKPFAPGVFEFLTVREFVGVVEEHPVPALLVSRPAAQPPLAPASRYPLVSSGKHGAAKDVAGFHGRRVRLSGLLVYREGLTMIELVSGSLQPAGSPADTGPESLAVRDFGRLVLKGEIVDSKCYWGVMNPGNGKVHKDCAVRCISGGIPPAFLVKGRQNRSVVLLLVGPNGESIHRSVLDRVAEPVEIQGRVMRLGDTLILKAEPSAIRRL
ncbi:MAG: Rieske 2Fe-2S domain-containing protein [Acidobacteriota bacterium]